MRKVKNQSVMWKIARAQIRENRRKNAVILLAIALTCLMFTTLFSVMMSLNATMQAATMRQVGGSSMAGFKCVLPEDYEKVKADEKTRDVSYRIVIGTAVNSEFKDTGVEVYYATDDSAEGMFCSPTTGRMPQEYTEVATSTIVLDKLGIAHKLGEKVPLDLLIGRSVDGADTDTCEFTLCGFWEGDSVAMSQMCYLSRAFCDEAAPTPTVPSWENTDMYTGYWMVDFNFKSSVDIEGQMLALMERLGLDPEETAYGVNWAYSAGSVDATSVLLLAVLFAIILLAGYLIIYNIFYINVVADIHSYGLLKTIGTTARQLKKLVRIQALFYCIAGIPLGLLCGTVISRLIFPVIVGTLSVSESAYTFSFSPFIYLFAVGFSLVTVFLSCGKPCRTAGRVSPVEAVSYNGVEATRKKRKRTGTVNAFTLALSGLSRSRKKLCVVVLSLSLSLLLANSVYSVVQGFDSDKYLENMIVGDISIQDVSLRNASSIECNYWSVTEEDRAFFDSLDGVSQSNVYWTYASLPFTDRIEQMMEGYQKNVPNLFRQDMKWCMNDRQIDGDVYGVDAFALDYMEVYDGRIDAEAFMSGGYAIVYGMQLVDSSSAERADFYQVGEEMEVELEDGTKTSYEVMAIASLPYPLTTQSYYIVGAQICLPAAEVAAHVPDSEALYSVLRVDPDKLEAVEAEVNAYVEHSENLCCVSKKSYMDEFDGFIRMFYLVGGALAAVLALIGILNFVNAIITGVLARKREFAMMEAVGMTAGQLTAMLVWEGVFYAILTTVFTLVCNALVGGLLIQTLMGEIWFFTYHFTMKLILFAFPLLVLLTAVVPCIACRTMRKVSVVERMRLE